MKKHLESGILGEQYAANYLENQGCEIVLRNWRYKNLEVDLIVKDGTTLVFVEVKTRSKVDFGLPFEFVDLQKKQKLIRAADHYLKENDFNGEIRFDIVSVLLMSEVTIEHIKDAFWDE